MKADKSETLIVSNSFSSLSSETLVKQLNLNQQGSEKALKKLVITLLVCVVFMAIEFAGGYIARSLAIMTDAAHLLSDCVGFLISIFSIWLGRRPNSSLMTFGFHRSEILGAFVSVVIIYGLTIWLVVEAIHRISNPVPINGLIMLITSIFGLACNIVMATTLHDHHGHSHGHHHSDENLHTPEPRKIAFDVLPSQNEDDNSSSIRSNNINREADSR